MTNNDSASVSTLIDATRQKDVLTANMAVTNSTSLSNCLDFFFLAGSSRRTVMSGDSDELDELVALFERARAEDLVLTYKILFWARDCRGGAGEKKFFQVFAQYIKTCYPKDWEKIYTLIPVYGYWKDFFVVEEPSERTIGFLGDILMTVKEGSSDLLAKWFPRKGKWFTSMHKAMNTVPKKFRQYLVSRTRVVETQMCNKEWKDIEYSKIPSIAMHKYRNAFGKRDAERFKEFNVAVLKGEEKVNASVLHPHQLYDAITQREDETAVEAQWISLPNYMEGSEERIIPVCDVSASMEGLPMSVSVSLGLYIAERNKGIFKNAFITFSEVTKMLYIKGGSLAEKMRQLEASEWGMNTNLMAVFMLILNSAIDNDLPESQMPTKILIISDMEFDRCADVAPYETLMQLYKESGYKLPDIIFWNVDGRIQNVPVNKNQKGVGLVSGFSPAILTAILGGEPIPTPQDLMLNALSVERYNPVSEVLAV